ncbi:MAG: hypothetical protein GF401_13620 [Chitinivibrionales bacterium]|nr:hypothetical protein [Chitinivibrionales bacterium]
MMRTLYGVVPTEEGKYFCSTLCRTESGWSCRKTESWTMDNRLKNNLLLYRGVSLGLPSHWTPSRSSMEYRELRKIDEERDFVPATQPVPYDIHTRTLGNNLIAVVPDDAFLSTIPIQCGRFNEQSFVSIFRSSHAIKIGVVSKKSLLAVFNCAPARDELIPAHIARLKQYFRSSYRHVPFPDIVAVIGGEPIEDIPGYALEHIDCAEILNGTFSEDAIKAAGVALSSEQPWSVPLFSGETQTAGMRKIRSGAYLVSAGLIAAGFILALSLWLWGLGLSWRLKNYNQQYQELVANNRDIQELLDKNDQLAKRILSVEDKLSNRTSWARFLQELSDLKPQGLYFERLGSQPNAKSEDLMEIAAAGWAKDEALVTKAIARLQKLPFLVDVRLSSIGRDQKKLSICRFKLFCTLKLREKNGNTGKE